MIALGELGELTHREGLLLEKQASALRLSAAFGLGDSPFVRSFTDELVKFADPLSRMVSGPVPMPEQPWRPELPKGPAPAPPPPPAAPKSKVGSRTRPHEKFTPVEMYGRVPGEPVENMIKREAGPQHQWAKNQDAIRSMTPAQLATDPRSPVTVTNAPFPARPRPSGLPAWLPWGSSTPKTYPVVAKKSVIPTQTPTSPELQKATGGIVQPPEISKANLDDLEGKTESWQKRPRPPWER